MSDNTEMTTKGLSVLIFAVVLLFFESTRPYALIFFGLLVVFMVGLYLWTTAATERDLAEARQEGRKHQQERRKHQDALKEAERTISSIVSQHLDTLANRRDTLVRVDRYGVVEGKEWNREVQHFCDKVIRPKLTAEEAQAVATKGMSSVFQRLVEDRVAQHCENRRAPPSVPDTISATDFEGLCAAVLRQHGWDASTTKGSGDQGADVIAEKNGRKLILQCKLYTGTIGNKAVQEVLAAKHFYSADLAAVVSKTEFTRSAKELAQASNIYTLHYSELQAFAEEYAGASGQQILMPKIA